MDRCVGLAVSSFDREPYLKGAHSKNHVALTRGYWYATNKSRLTSRTVAVCLSVIA